MLNHSPPLAFFCTGLYDAVTQRNANSHDHIAAQYCNKWACLKLSINCLLMRKPTVVMIVVVKMQLSWWEKMYYGNELMQQNLKNSQKISLLKRKTSALSLKGFMTMSFQCNSVRNRWTQGRNATDPYVPCTNTHKVAGSLLHPMQIIIKEMQNPGRLTSVRWCLIY